MTAWRGRAALAAPVLALALAVPLTGCTDDDAHDGATPVQHAVADAAGGAVLQQLAQDPDALRAAADAPGTGDDLLDVVAAAGGGDQAAEAFRTAYLASVRDGIERAVREGVRSTSWSDTLAVVQESWIEPSGEVLGAVESACESSDGSCNDRLRETEDALRDAVDGAVYATMPVRLLPRSLVVDGRRVPMERWTVQQRDDWQRLHDTSLLPWTLHVVEDASAARRQAQDLD